jgi:serine/threonine protein kinase
MSEAARCPRCGTGFPPNRREGLCPACLIKAALELEEDESGQRIGPYTTIRVLGRGDRGIVFLAQQKEPVRRSVALKVFRAGADRTAAWSAHILLEHPNIARPLEAGTTTDGRAYYATEYVAGLPIVEYCDVSRLANRDRLMLLVQACRGVHYAHERGICHGKLRASNVLVEDQESKAVAKVTDFGESDGDPAADITALGALLYELVAGSPPLDNPLPLSELWKSMGERAESLAARRQTNVRALGRELRGQLEGIAGRALEKDASRGFASAADLAAEVEAYLRATEHRRFPWNWGSRRGGRSL